MVKYPDLSNLNNASGIGGLMSLPNSSYPYYWLWIFAGIWAIISISLYFKEKEKTGKGRILSSMAVASFVMSILATIGTIFWIISVDILVYILVFTAIIIAVWFFSTK